MAAIDQSMGVQGQGLSQVACIGCRKAKMKCIVNASDGICQRCLRKSLNCVFQQHRRGRKPGTRVKKQRQSEVPIAAGQEWDGSRDCISPPSTTDGAVQSPQSDSIRLPKLTCTIASTQGESSYPTWQMPGGGLQPSELLNRDAQDGNFSLKNVLAVPDILRVNDENTIGNIGEIIFNDQDYGPEDPITCAILTYPVAIGLFEKFMRSNNPYISQFDPKLHTFEYVRQKSSFLLTAIVAAAAKAFHPPLHSELRSHREKLLGNAFSRGEKTVETVQAILVLTYWKEPDETRTWLLIGYAIRMCLEMGWHELKTREPNYLESGDELSAREKRNIERTWLVLFVYDRSISSQMGKPWMIEQNHLIRNADNWYNNPLAAPGIDALLSGFVRLRVIHCDILELLSESNEAHNPSRSERLVKIFHTDIGNWEEHWLKVLGSIDNTPCQAFLIKFYGLHLRVLLNSFLLQRSLSKLKKGALIPRPTLWICYSNAVGMLDEISQTFGPLKLLYFAQDSVHVMTAYAAIFLIKLLLSISNTLRAELEESAIVAIRNASATFREQCTTSKAGCALQASFLTNVVEKYETLRDKSGLLSVVGVNDALAARVPDMSHPGTANKDPEIHRDQDHTLPPSSDNEPSSTDPTRFESNFEPYMFADEGLWESLFADAGFQMNDGVFLTN